MVQIGSRLGIDYVRSIQEFVTISVFGQSITINQCSIGPLAISFVVWDAGLYLTDFLVYCFKEAGKSTTSFSLGAKVLDLGCGTGIGGICALMMGADFVLFSDSCSIDLANSNIHALPHEELYRGKFSLVEYEWSKILVGHIPSEFRHGSSIDSTIITTTTSETEQQGDIIWDSVICSDVLYDSKSHAALLRVLETLSFHQAIIVYKKRHEVEEEAFFQCLSEWCELEVIDPLVEGISFVNIKQSDLASLYIIIAKPISQKTNIFNRK